MKRTATIFLTVIMTIALLTACQPSGQSAASSQSSTAAPASSDAAGGGTPPADTTPIKIGVIAPLSGAGTSYGIGIKQGAEMAIDEINAEGGINGRPVEMKIVDDATNPAESVTAIQRLIDHEEVDIIVGGWGSSQVLAAIPVSEKSGVPYIVVGATNAAITTTDNYWTFAVIKSDDLQAESLASAAINDMKFERIAIIYDTNDYGTGNKNSFLGVLQEMGKEPVIIESYKSDDKEFTAQLSKIKAAEPDAIAVFGTIPGAPAIMIQARNLGIEARFIGTGGLANDQLIDLGGEAAEGTVLTTYFHEDTNASAAAFAKALNDKFGSGSDPVRPILSAWEYRTIKQILKPVLEQVGTDKEALRSAVKDWRGEIIGFDGELYFNDRYQLEQPSVLIEVKDGKFVLYQ